MAILNLGCRAKRWQELSFEQIRGCLLRCRQETGFCGERIDLPAWKKGWLTCITMLQKESGSPAILLDDTPRGIFPLRSRLVSEQHMIELVDFPKGTTTSHTPSKLIGTQRSCLPGPKVKAPTNASIQLREPRRLRSHCWLVSLRPLIAVKIHSGFGFQLLCSLLSIGRSSSDKP